MIWDFFFQFFVAKNTYLVRMKFMKFKWILQSLAMPVVYVSYMIYASLQDLNLTVFGFFAMVEPMKY